MEPSLLHSSVFPAVVPHSALVDVVSHGFITSPPTNKQMKFLSTMLTQMCTFKVLLSSRVSDQKYFSPSAQKLIPLI